MYFSDEFFIEQLDQESFINELNNIVEDVDKKNISVEKKKIFVKNFLFSISCYPKNNHSNQINGTIITLPSIFPEYYHKSDFHTSKTFLSFTRMGKLLNSILPGNHPAVVRYKSEIINLILDPSPVIFPIESHHARFLTTIIGFIEGKKTKMVLSANEYEEIHQVFLKPDDEFCIGFFSVESTSHSLQKKIVDYCIEQNLKKNETSRSRIIVTVEELSDITQLYPLLVQICRFHNIQTPYVCHFSQEELLKIVRSYLSFSELNTNFFNFSMNTFLENIRDSWDLYELIDYIDSQITLEKLEGSLDNAIIEEKKALILKQAVSEGKNALKDNVLMFQLASICSSQSEIAHLLGVHRSSVSRFFKENNKKK